MKKFLKWTGIVLLVLIVVVVAFAFIMQGKYKKMAKVKYEVTVPTIAIPTDSASLARGASLAASLCSGCHGGDYAGKKFFDDPTIGVVWSANITTAGQPKNYTDADYIRSIRYGVKPDGHGLFVMPVQDFNYLSDEDLGSIIAYLKTVPPTGQESPAPEFTFFSEVLAGLGAFGDLYSCELLDLNDASVRTAPPFGETVEFGKYTMLIHGCWSCHGEQMNGNKSPDPVSPPGANISPAGNIGKWSYEQFYETLHTGKTPEGKELNMEFMPWPYYRLMTDTEMKALFMYLQTVPAAEDSEVLREWKEKNA